MAEEATQPGSAPASFPRSIGPYQIQAEIARGGMGIVYQARQEGLNRLVALKVVDESVTSPLRHRERFLREARAAARLHHPGIVPVYEMGSDSGRDYFAMRLVEGPSLAQAMESSDFSPPRALGWMREVCAAVHHAHINGIVHRDLKPSNILLENGERPLVTDFGVARDYQQTRLTVAGDILGTPEFLAPEQISETAGAIDARTDVYALGVILYMILAPGRASPFAARNTPELLARIAAGEHVPLMVRNPGADREAVVIVERAMARRPAERYLEARLLGEDLERHLHGLPVQARPIGRREFLVRHIRAHLPAVVSVALLAVTSVVLAVLLAGASGRSAEHAAMARRLLDDNARLRDRRDRRRLVEAAARRRADAARLIEAGDPAAAEPQVRALKDEAPDDDDARRLVHRWCSLAVARAPEAIARLYGTSLDERTFVGAWVRAVRAHEQSIRTGDPAQRNQLLRSAVRLCDRSVALRGDFSPVLVRRGRLRRSLGDRAGAHRDFSRAIRLAAAPDAYRFRGELHLEAGNHQAAGRDLDEAIRLDPSSAGAFHVRGRLLRELGRHEQAIGEFTRAILLRPRFAMALVGRGVAHVALKRLEEGIGDFTAALRLDPELVVARYHRGRSYYDLGWYPLATADLSWVIPRSPELAAAIQRWLDARRRAAEKAKKR